MSHKIDNPAGLTDEQLEALRVAVYLSGGASKVAKAMGYRTSESVRRFCIKGGKPVPAERAADFRKAVENRLTLAQIRPDLYADIEAAKGGKGKAA